MSAPTLNAYNIADLRDIAQHRLPRFLFEFGDRGTEEEVSLRNNRAVFDRIRFNPRTLVDVAGRNQEITLFGKKHKMPVGIAPTGLAGLWWHEGELALARAAAAAGSPASTSSRMICRTRRWPSPVSAARVSAEGQQMPLSFA